MQLAQLLLCSFYWQRFSDNTKWPAVSHHLQDSDKPHVPLHVVKLESVIYGEPFDVGTIVLPLAASLGPQKVLLSKAEMLCVKEAHCEVHTSSTAGRST